MPRPIPGFNVATLKTEQVPYVDDQVLANAGDVLIPDVDAKEKLVQRLFVDAIATPAAAEDPAAVAAVDVSSLHVDVQNGSGIPGLGKTAADRLRQRGFQIDTVENAASSNHTVSEIHLATTVPYAGARVRNDLGLAAASIITDPPAAAGSAVADITVILGTDYH